MPSCKSNDSQDMLLAYNPAILELEPIPGGFVRIKEDDQCRCKKSSASVKGAYSRSSRIDAATKEILVQQGLNEIDWTTTATEPQHSVIGIYNPLNDSITMLSIVISTVLLMATDSKIPCIHLDWTKKYLNCIKDEYGNHPPNVQGILNHIRLLSGEREEKRSCDQTSDNKSVPSKGSQESSRVRTSITVRRNTEDQQ